MRPWHGATWRLRFSSLLYVALVLGIGLSRSYIGYHETDYVQFFVPDAERFLAGEPLRSVDVIRLIADPT